MSEALASALATPGFPLILLAALVAGLVRGFAGFGAAMIFIPVAARLTDPITTVVMLQIMDGIGALPLLPRGLRDGEPRQVAFMTLASALSLPFGLYLLVTVEGVVFRWIVSGLILLLLGLMISGWRYRARLGRAGTAAVGAVSGLMSGFFGMGGPPVILMYMSGPYRPPVIRANIIIFFFLVTILGVALLFWRGLLTPERVWLALILVLPYGAASWAGQRLFRAELEWLFRLVAYAVILGSVVMSLPLWS